MIKKFISTAFIVPVLILAMVFLVPENTYAQKKKKQQLAKEKFEMDALALAFARCKLDLLRYESEQKPENKDLSKGLAQMAFLEGRFRTHLWAKHQKLGDWEALDKEINSVKKKLSVCVKYQNIQDAIEQEKEKANSAKKE